MEKLMLWVRLHDRQLLHIVYAMIGVAIVMGLLKPLFGYPMTISQYLISNGINIAGNLLFAWLITWQPTAKE